MAFLLDAHDRELIVWQAVANAGIGGSDVHDMLLEAVNIRFGSYHAPEVIEILSDNGSAYIAKKTRILTRQLGLTSCFTPVSSPQSNGMSEAYAQAQLRAHPSTTQRRNRFEFDRRMDRGL